MSEKISSITYTGKNHVYNFKIDGKLISVVDHNADGKIDRISGDEKFKARAQKMVFEFRRELPKNLKTVENNFKDVNVAKYFEGWAKAGSSAIWDEDMDGKIDTLSFITKGGCKVWIMASKIDTGVSKIAPDGLRSIDKSRQGVSIYLQPFDRFFKIDSSN